MWKEYVLLSPAEVLKFGIGTCTDQIEYERIFFENKRIFSGFASNAPDPGYFLNLSIEGKTLANKLIHNGYIELNEQNAKIYFDSFKLMFKQKDDYLDNELGNLYQTETFGDEYINLIHSNYEKPYKEHFVTTPLEKKKQNELTFFKRLKQLILGDLTNDKSTETRKSRNDFKS